ncbi:MAG: phosphate acyltransferase PlsX [Planctomycetota bacterium]
MDIALDAMGGDHAPGPIVAGALKALESDPELRVTLVGDESAIRSLMGGSPPSRASVFHCTQVIGMDESPASGFRRKPDNSIARCWQLLAQGKVGGIVSAGNTGAMVAGGLFSRRFLKHIDRPAIATVMPTLKGPSIMLDVGANVNPKAEQLFQYGLMGEIYARLMFNKPKPTIGLMNVGSEEGKGNELVKQTQSLFNNSPLRANYLGNIDGRDIHQGVADVIVTDGFVGNVVLKVCEGLFDFMIKMVAQELNETLVSEKDLAKKAIHTLISRYDYSAFGGAPLLGIDGICIISHGSSGERAISNALALAAKLARAGINSQIVQELDQIPSLVGAGSSGA